MVTQVEIAKRLGLDVSSVNKILNRRAGPVFKKETIRRVFKVARDLGYDFGRIKFVHRRRHSRRRVAYSAEFYVYNDEGALYDKGTATIRDLSLCGAKVSDVALPLGSLPTEPFSVSLRPLVRPLDDLEIPGMIVRIHMNGSAQYGICFRKLEAPIVERLKRITGR